MTHQIKVLQSLITSFLQAGKGVSGTAHPKQPEKMLELYEFEACPYCRRVREVMTVLNLDYISYPCPKNGSKYRPKADELNGGKPTFPLLVDPNTDTQLTESQDIINYLFQHYGKTGKTPNKWQNLGDKPSLANAMASLVSGMRGLKAKKTNRSRTQPEQLLELYSFDASPYSRLVRERLTELELAYINHNVAKERWQDMGPAILRLKPGKYEPIKGGKRDKIFNDAMQGRLQVPYLIDPNTDTQLFESKDILNYLNHHYG